MAIQNDPKKEWESLKGNGPKGYLRFFWDYYRLVVLALIALIVLGIVTLVL